MCGDLDTALVERGVVVFGELKQVCVLLCGPPVPLGWGRRGGEREEEEEGEEGEEEEEEDHNVCVSNRTQHTHTARRAQSTQL